LDSDESQGRRVVVSERRRVSAFGIDEIPEFRATVEMEIRAKVDTNHPWDRRHD